jgi:hypothetical protein
MKRLLGAALMCLTAACSTSADSGGSAPSGNGAGNNTGTGTGGFSGGVSGTGGATLPPETEV